MQGAGADDGGTAHAAGNDGRVAGHAAAGGQDAAGHVHALDIFRGGFFADQDDSLAFLAGLGGIGSGEVQGAGGSAGGRGQTAGDQGGGLQGTGIKVGVQQGVKLLGLHLQHGLFFGQLAVFNEINGDLHGGAGGALAVAGLQHKQLAALDRKLHVLHVMVV